jgi:predicted CXXCH cytochrome family protein
MRKAASWTCAVALLSVACSPTARHKALSTFFDGVPPLETADRPTGPPQGTGMPGAPPRHGQGSEHGPYASKLCDACHVKGATNALVAPPNELCAQCHTIDMNKKFMHGPLTSGDCLVCHDPHSSRYPYLLVSDSGTVCLDCHDRETVAAIEGHGSLEGNCTTCHDAHGSDTKYLLK